MLVGKTSSLPTVLYDTVTRLQWTTTSVLIFTRETCVRSPSTGAIHAPVIFGFHAVVATLQVVVVCPGVLVVAITLLWKGNVVVRQK